MKTLLRRGKMNRRFKMTTTLLLATVATTTDAYIYETNKLPASVYANLYLDQTKLMEYGAKPESVNELLMYGTAGTMVSIKTYPADDWIQYELGFETDIGNVVIQQNMFDTDGRRTAIAFSTSHEFEEMDISLYYWNSASPGQLVRMP